MSHKKSEIISSTTFERSLIYWKKFDMQMEKIQCVHKNLNTKIFPIQYI